MNKTLLLLLLPVCLFSQPLMISDPYLQIKANPDDPLFTTYTAAMERSVLYGDKGYKMNYYSNSNPVTYGSEVGGRFFTLWKVNQVVVNKTSEFKQGPVVLASFPDMAILEYEPFLGLKVQETFFVYSSNVAMVRLCVKNTSQTPQMLEIFPVFELGNDSLQIIEFGTQHQAYISTHFESRYRLISSLRENFPYPTHVRNVFSTDFQNYSYGAYNGTSDGLYNIMKTDFYAKNRSDSLNLCNSGNANYMVLHGKWYLDPGAELTVSYFRGWQDIQSDPVTLLNEIEILIRTDIQSFLDDNIRLYQHIPRIHFKSEDEKLVYLGAFNLVRGCMLPPSGRTNFNHYVFSREPLWGWGHGHQVLHESLSMLAYVYLDPVSAQNSQRVYMEQQRDDGLIAYRHGPRGMQDYPHYSKYLEKDMSTTSAPFFNWINWEIFQVSGDSLFLEDAYRSGTRYINWLIQNRDLDGDGLFEWGPYGLIENVRDWYNAVFQVSADRFLSVDKEDISDDLECLDLTLMMIKEMRSLARMAEAMGKKEDEKAWSELAERTANLVNRHMWCDQKKFYFSVDRDDHSFMYLTRDLRREEIIGFLPLWAEAVPTERVRLLIDKLMDEGKFWRRYGIPTLAADDVWYSPNVDYCCKWNGPVWLLWNYMVIHGLRNYHYHNLADRLTDKMMDAVVVQLKKNHNFWESYSPDNEVLNCPPNYIWDAIMAKVLIEKYTFDKRK